jgi:Raf kinase inhibitor-like YbhB/YbcL family protein
MSLSYQNSVAQTDIIRPMRTKLMITGVVILAVATAGVGYVKLSHRRQNKEVAMEITSPAFSENEPIPSEYTCKGENVNPPIEIAGVPAEAKSIALIIDDPDAPGGTFDHWVVWNIDPAMTRIPRDWSPGPGVVVGANGSDEAKYMGPCPPSGTHHYHFKVFALSQKIDLTEGAAASALVTAMDGHIVGQGELIGTFSK